MKKVSCILSIGAVLILSCNNSSPSLKVDLPKLDDLEQKEDTILEESIQAVSSDVIENQTNKKTLSLVLWENDYFNLALTAEYASCEMKIYDAHLDLDTVETTSEMGCSISSIPFVLRQLKLNSVKVEQARLESIAISQPPSDGFDRAGLNELVLQSDWVTYANKNGMYVPFSSEDSRFVIKEKPKLTTAFITDLLEKSNREVAPELLEGFLETNSQAYWINCTTIIRITGLDADGKRVAKYILDNELCLQD